jgi:hypothetical protein
MSDRSGCGDSSLASASGGSETQASPPEPEPNGPAVLDSVTQCLVPLGRGTADREAGHCGGLASRRIPVVLALAVSRAVAEPKSPSKSRSLSAGWYAPRRSRKAVTGFFAEPPRGHRRARLLHGADGQLPRVVLLVRHRARTAQDCTFPRDRAPELGLGGPATTRSLSRLGPLPIRDPGSGYKVRCRGSGRAALHRSETQAHQPRISLAERSGGTMGWKLPPGVLDHVIPLDRTALATTDSGLHSLLPFGPNPRRARQGHSRSAFH